MEMVFSIYCSARIYWQALSLLGQRHSFGSVCSTPVRPVEEDLKLLNFSLTMAWRKAINWDALLAIEDTTVLKIWVCCKEEE